MKMKLIRQHQKPKNYYKLLEQLRVAEEMKNVVLIKVIKNRIRKRYKEVV